jgi:hypothetical protein
MAMTAPILHAVRARGEIMLRVRPVHFTSRIEEWEQLFTDLGMVKTLDDGNWREFDAASGRIALQHTPADAGNDGTTSLAVEVGDVEEFARRTNLAASEMGNTPAELIPADVGDSCRITGGDGFSFMADKATHWAQCADADTGLAVVGVWFTEDTAGATATLSSIGARFRPVPDADETADFTAKNGGVLMVRPGSGPARSGFGFEYDGDLDALRQRLTSAGHKVTLTEEAFSRSLHVANPDTAAKPDAGDRQAGPHIPPTIWISKRAPLGG